MGGDHGQAGIELDGPCTATTCPASPQVFVCFQNFCRLFTRAVVPHLNRQPRVTGWWYFVAQSSAEHRMSHQEAEFPGHAASEFPEVRIKKNKLPPAGFAKAALGRPGKNFAAGAVIHEVDKKKYVPLD